MRNAVEELLHGSRVTVKCGEICVSVPVKAARKALKLARSLSVHAKSQPCGEGKGSEKASSDTECGERRERVRKEAADKGEDAERACRNWVLEVEAPSMERVLDSMPKFKTAFVKQLTPEAPMLEGSKGVFVVHLSLSCSRSTFTQKSMKEGAQLTKAEKRQRLTPAEAHALIGDGYREFAGVAE